MKESVGSAGQPMAEQAGGLPDRHTVDRCEFHRGIVTKSECQQKCLHKFSQGHMQENSGQLCGGQTLRPEAGAAG